MNGTSTKRLTARRGSLSASDPWAKHAVDTSETSCRLSIMTVGPALEMKPPPLAHTRRFASTFTKDSTSPRRAQKSVKSKVSPDELVQLARPITTSSRPLSFTPLPDDIQLPFGDRASEVSALIHSAPSNRLFALLQLTFNESAHAGSDDPAKWSYTQLHDWLTKTNRDTVPDSIWVANMRRCIMAHSETIWERVKGALGVPYELDFDEVEVDDVNTSDLEDSGRKARGHWDDWDAVLDSPVVESDSPSPERRDGAISPLIIEPILSSPSNSPFFTPSPANSHAALGGITEEEENTATATTNSPEEEKDGGILPSQVHGIRISTSPMPPSPLQSPVYGRPGFETRRMSSGSNRSQSSSFRDSPVGWRSRPASISSFSSLNLGPHASSVEERSSPLFPSSFAALKPKTVIR